MKMNGKTDNRNNRTMNFDMKKADLDKDGKLSSYEKKRGMAIERAMAKQNRIKKEKGGFIAKGCGAVMNNRRKVTTIS